MVRRFAEGTKVAASKTKTEIDELLSKHDASQRGIFEEKGRGVVLFTMKGRQIRLSIKLPVIEDFPGKDEPRGWWRWSTERKRQWRELKLKQESSEVWRRLLLVTKAKLELVAESGDFESEFLANVVLPDGRTVHEALAPQLDASYSSGNMPPLLGPHG